MRQPSHNYHIESRKDKNGKGVLYFNLNYGYKDYNPKVNSTRYKSLKISTGYRLSNSDLVDGTISRTYISKYGRDIKNHIDKVEEVSYEALKEYRKEYESNPTPKELKEIISKELNGDVKEVRSESIVDFIDYVIEQNKNRTPTTDGYLKPRTIKDYRNIKTKLGQYEMNTKKQLLFTNYNLSAFEESLMVINNIAKENQIKNDEPITGYTCNYMSKISKDIISILNKADDYGFTVMFNTRGKKLKETRAKSSAYFTEDDLEKIINANVEHSSTLQSAKDYIIISSLTALRLEDMLNLNTIKVQHYGNDDNGFKGINTLISKVSKPFESVRVVIPVFKPVFDVYVKNGHQFPKFPKNVSQYIKRLCEFLEINEPTEESILYYGDVKSTRVDKPKFQLMSAHKCRNSFVTNLKHLGLPRVISEGITHPKKGLQDMYSRYDNSDLEANAQLIYNQRIESKKKSKVYYF